MAVADVRVAPLWLKLASSLKLLVTTAPAPAQLLQLAAVKNVHVVSLAELEAAGQARQAQLNTPPEFDAPTASDLWSIIYTSGTTGEPKGAMYTHAAILRAVAAEFIDVKLRLTDKDLEYFYMPTAHIYTRNAFVRFMRRGPKIGFPTFADVSKCLLADIQELKPTSFVTVPAILNSIHAKALQDIAALPEAQRQRFQKEFDELNGMAIKQFLEEEISPQRYPVFSAVSQKVKQTLGGRVRIISCGSAILSPEVRTFCRLLFHCAVFEGYGLTEVAVVSTTDPYEDEPGVVGRPVSVVEVRLVPTADGRREVCLRSPLAFSGYYRRPPGTGFDADGFYHTGDSGDLSEKGSLRVFGRMESIVKMVNGEFLAPESVENDVKTTPLVAQAVVYVEPNWTGTVILVEPNAEALLKFLTGKKLVKEDATFESLPKPMITNVLHQAIIATLKKHGRPTIELPRAIEVVPVDSFAPFTTPTRKLKRKLIVQNQLDKLRELYHTPQKAQAALVATAPAQANAAVQSNEAGTCTIERMRCIWRKALELEPGKDDVSPSENLFAIGGNSRTMLALQGAIQHEFGVEVPIAMLFQNPTLAAMSQYVQSLLSSATPSASFSSLPAAKRSACGRVSVVGLKFRISGLPPTESTLDGLWQLICAKKNIFRRFTATEMLEQGVPAVNVNCPQYVPVGAVLDDAEMWDPSFWLMNLQSSSRLNPQTRILAEDVFHALEDANMPAARSSGRVGVFGGVGDNSYQLTTGSTDDIFQETVGNGLDYSMTRVAYLLGLRGPAVNTQTACSTGLVALHLACGSLRAGDCDVAVVASCNVRLPQKQGFIATLMMSPDGSCRPFDATANGTVFTNASVALVLQLSEDVKPGARRYCDVIGSAINNDGHDKVTYTAPSTEAQCDVIQQALRNAGAAPSSIGLVETHGTATLLGDPIEFAALCHAFTSAPKQSVCIGAVKANMGHTKQVAGLAGLVSAIASLRHATFPPLASFSTPSRLLSPPVADSPFFVVSSEGGRPWPAPQSGRRRAGISSFGVGGTNAHVIIEEVEEQQQPKQEESPISKWQILPVSGHSLEQLHARSSQISNFINNGNSRASALAHCLQNYRTHHTFRSGCVVDTSSTNWKDNATQALASFDFGRCRSVKDATPQLVLLFPGQQAYSAHMGRTLFQSHPTFKEAAQQCLTAIGHTLSLKDPESFIFEEESTAPLRVQLTLFVFMYSLATLCQKLFGHPAAMLGHSLGEYVAAHLAGVFSLEDTIKLIIARARALDKCEPGRMLAAMMTEEDAKPFVSAEISLGAVNNKDQIVFSGREAAITALKDTLTEKGTKCLVLKTTHAFHSHLIEPALAEFGEVVRQIQLSAPKQRIVSCMTGKWLKAEEASSAEYWVKHFRNTVRYFDGITTILSSTPLPFIVETGPATLSMLKTKAVDFVPLLPRVPANAPPCDELLALHEGTLAAFCAGINVQWSEVHPGEVDAGYVPLPHYPFSRVFCSVGHSVHVSVATVAAPQLKPEAPAMTASAEPMQSTNSKTEQRIVAAAQSLLKKYTGAANTAFVDCGMNSILVMQFHGLICKEFGLTQAKVPYDFIFRYPTAPALARFICSVTGSTEISSGPESSESQIVAAPATTFSYDKRFTGPISIVEHPTCRVIVFPPLGMGVGAFSSWQSLLPSGCELTLVSFDPVPLTWDDLLERALHAVTPLASAEGVPCVIYGHSFGALVAYEVARRLPKAPALFVAGAAAEPGVQENNAMSYPLVVMTPAAPDTNVIQLLNQLGWMPTDLLPRMPDSIAAAEARLLAQYKRDSKFPLKLNCPVTAIHASFDSVLVFPQTVFNWRRVAAHQFTSLVVPGPHFFCVFPPSELMALLRSALCPAGPMSAPAPVPLAGAWSLVSTSAVMGTPPNAIERASHFAPDAVGVISYTPDGHMCVQILPSTVGDARSMVMSSISYYGSYTYDEQTGMVEHEIVNSLYPQWRGRVLKRIATLTNGVLSLDTEPIGAYHFTLRLSWRKLASRSATAPASYTGTWRCATVSTEANLYITEDGAFSLQAYRVPRRMWRTEIDSPSFATPAELEETGASCAVAWGTCEIRAEDGALVLRATNSSLPGGAAALASVYASLEGPVLVLHGVPQFPSLRLARPDY
eukprot:TRINITY_DN5707_c0_g1_i1.p1 TRINITY_DN5707_c0_g1~~TRINITY_DN5707_c0_g1_i1.p1  ORF type:complete len:2269 (-),score=448.65 TRINITY_DN5707_c0_g1_i1:89-6487(-)